MCLISAFTYQASATSNARIADRVELNDDGMGVSIKLPIAGTEESRAQLSDAVAITRSFPMQLKRHGVELRLVVGDHDRSAATVDLPLLKAVARAHRWFDEISTGKAISLAEIAAREGLGRSLDPPGLPGAECR